ncbi:endonuclease/exonuclease/phosphatase family protein [uncultured Croceitalea sp.]|uniref:endonuclease/exonuclease/phosphatase family protein n=1 Tax=uncultured Croceitalea sp. TaxID=1798908 RepID=UPI00374E44BC
MKKLSFFNKLVFILNCIVALVLLIACLNSYLTVNILSSFYIFSLFIPLLFLFNLFFCLYWLFKRKKHFFLSFVVLSIGYFVFGVFYKVNSDKNKSDSKSLTILNYNVWGFNKNEWIKEPNIGDKIIEFIKDEDPDILCLQEHSRIRYTQLLQYPYRSETPYTTPRSIQAIFSKFPIVSSGSLELPNTINNIIYADIVSSSDTIRVYNMHLQSYNIVPSSETLSEKESERTYHKIIETFSKQLTQAKIFKEHLDKSPYKTIISGDFNNTQFSNVYRIVKGDFQDSFLEAGEGFGRTYDLKGLPMRIDYILADNSFEVLEHQNYDVKLSDHYPIKATLKIKD